MSLQIKSLHSHTSSTISICFFVSFFLSLLQNLSEWVTNQHRDTYASHVAHYDQLAYYAVAQNESIGRVRLQFLDKMIQPCGP
jgi:hypothetical protein